MTISEIGVLRTGESLFVKKSKRNLLRMFLEEDRKIRSPIAVECLIFKVKDVGIQCSTHHC